MSSSQRVRLRDMRDIHRLIAECCELGADAAAWQQHMLAGCLRLVDAQVGMTGGGRWLGPDDVFEPLSFQDRGWSTVAERNVFLHYMTTHGPSRDIAFHALYPLRGRRLVHRTRRELIDDATWYGSDQFNEYHRVSRIDDFINSMCQVPGAASEVTVLGIYRAVGKAPFCARESRMMRIFHDELAGKCQTVLARATAPRRPALSPRMRQTLERLLQGHSEKQLARLLGISRPTAHQYVTALYRHFEVASRSELMAHFLRRGVAPPDDQPTDPR